MGPNTRGCLDSVKYWLSAPCADDDEDDFDFPDYSEKRGVYYDQPRPITPIRSVPARPVSRGRQQQRRQQREQQSQQQNQWPSSRVDDMGWLDKFFFSRRRRSPGRRTLPVISHPTNFQHTGTGAVNFRNSIRSFRRLELSIYETDNGVSPILPYFIGPNPDLALPEPARTRNVFDDDDSTLHKRSPSDFSFSIPRRPVGKEDAASYRSSSHFEESPPRIPPRAKTRPRAHTYSSPSVEAIVERIASAIIEKEILDAEIHSIKSRASMCLSRRPSTSYDFDEPIPAFPLVPPTAPSFAERVSIDRPRTAPSTQTVFRAPPPLSADASAPTPPPRRTRSRAPPFPERRSSFKAPQWKPNQASNQPPRSASAPEPTIKQAVPRSAFNSHPPLASPKIIDNSIDVSVPLAPPLPLILRPPLRKKKSFSRVSDWLFPDDMDKDISHAAAPTGPTSGAALGPPLASFAAHKRQLSLDSVTNAPRALTDRDGFYQTLPPSALFSGPRRSFDSQLSDASSQRPTVSIYSTDEEQTGGYGGPGTVATSTAWSPGSTPPEEVRRQADSWRQNEAGLRSFATSVSERAVAASGSASLASEPMRGGIRMVQEESEEEGEAAVQARRPWHMRQASLPAPRPTSVGVAF